MKKMAIIIQVLFVFLSFSVSVQAKEHTEIICSYAPSSSKVVGRLSSAAGGVGATALAITKATGLTAVAHSSGAYIFTGAGGYVAGTLGTAVVAPVAIGVGIVVGVTAGTVELLCAPKNHPKFAAKVKNASKKFARKFKKYFKKNNKTSSDEAIEVKKNRWWHLKKKNKTTSD
jgi:hypothetical protein